MPWPLSLQGEACWGEGGGRPSSRAFVIKCGCCGRPFRGDNGATEDLNPDLGSQAVSGGHICTEAPGMRWGRLNEGDTAQEEESAHAKALRRERA